MDLLKQNWISTNKFNYMDINSIYSAINIVLKKININSPFEKSTKKHIEIGDDLSGKTVKFEFPDDLYDEISNDVGGYGAVDIIATSNHSILEYANVSNSVATVSKDSWMDTIYHVNTNTGEIYKNLNELVLDDDWGQVTSINTSMSAYNHIYVIETETKSKKRGDFLFTEDLKIIEDSLMKISQFFNYSYVSRNWYKLSVFSYKDVNRWAIAINQAIEILTKSDKIVCENNEEIVTEDSINIMTEGGTL